MRFDLPVEDKIISIVDVDNTAEAITFSLSGSDPNGTVKIWAIQWNDDDDFVTHENGVDFTRTFNDSSVYTMCCYVRDDDGNASDTVCHAIHVRHGTPAVTSAACESSVVWVKDVYKYHVAATDTNGVIRKLYVNWDGNESPQDSIEIPGDGAKTVDTFFVHGYDTTGGNKTARFFAKDDDNVASSLRNVTVAVRKGAPAVSGDKGDTLWVVVDEGAGNYYYKPKYSDTNGTIQQFYFGFSNNFANATESTSDSSIIPIDENNFNSIAGTRYIWIKDDDGLVRGGRFVVFADSAPPEPIVNVGSRTADSITVKWVKDMDKIDQGYTHVQILVGYGSAVEPNTQLFTNPLPTVDSFETDPEDNTLNIYKFKATQAGTGKFRIQFIDARGTTSTSVDRGSF